MRGRSGEVGQEVRGLRSTNRYLPNSHVDVKYSIGNGVAEELTTMTRAHEQWCRHCLREWGVLGGEGEREEKSEQL